jgi:cell division protein FtsW (lipid II flippase)
MTLQGGAVMNAGTVPSGAAASAPARAAPWAQRVPALVEAAAFVAVLVLLLPWFDRVAEFGAGRDARFAGDAAKDVATRALFAGAGWQWAGAMMLGFACLHASRRARSALAAAGAGLVLWIAAGWAARVPWPLAGGGRDFLPLRPTAEWSGLPAAPALVLALIGALMIAAGLALTPRASPAQQTLGSRVGYAGLALATGIGWLLLLDLSAHAHAGNRYLALYHQGHLWLGMTVFSLLLFAREPLGRATGWLLAYGGELARRIAPGRGRVGFGLLLAASALALLALVGGALANLRQLTSELGRLWLIVGSAGFFFLRADPLARRVAISGRAAGSLLRYLAPLGFVVAVLVAAMLMTRDMGPLLIACYAGGGFVAATFATWWHQRGGGFVLPALAAVAVFVLWIAAVTLALLHLGSLDAVTAARLESVAAPFSAANDQLALVTWFQRAAPERGWGLGAVPWCGYALGGACSGVPAQVHSDYTFTALVGVFGASFAWLFALAFALWLHRLVRHHGRVTRGEPRLVASSDGALRPDPQALLSWVGVCWVALTLCQLAVTVAGNQGVLPLTGVTFPLVSYGMTSLVVNLAFAALCLNVTVAPRAAR